MPKSKYTNPMRTDYDRCVFLIFNYDTPKKLTKIEQVLFDGMRNKWGNKHDDPYGNNIHFIFVDPTDFMADEDISPQQQVERDDKYYPLRQLTSKSHLYLIGHHEINDNRPEVVNDYKVHEEDQAHYFHANEIAALLLKYISHQGVAIQRQHIQEEDIENRQQKLMISVSMCNTAVGMLVNGQRDTMTSLTAVLANELYNQSRDKLINSVLSGTTAWVYPMPGYPSRLNFLKLVFSSIDRICREEAYRLHAHKRYASSISLFGKYHEASLPRQGKLGEYKRYFDMDANTTIEDILNQKVNIQSIEGRDWYESRARSALNP